MPALVHRLLGSVTSGVRGVLMLLALGVLATPLTSGSLFGSNGWLALSGPDFWSGRIWSIITYPLVPGPLAGFLFNAVAIWFLGSGLERIWTPAQLWVACFVAALGTGFAKVIFQSADFSVLFGCGPIVLGLLAAWAYLFRYDKIHLGAAEIPVGVIAVVALALDFGMTFLGSGWMTAVVALSGALAVFIYVFVQARIVATRPSRVAESNRISRLEL